MDLDLEGKKVRVQKLNCLNNSNIERMKVLEVGNVKQRPCLNGD